MFRGSVPAEMRSIIREHVQHWDAEEVYVGCSGAFTIERVLHDLVKLHSNDVTLYSCAIGSWLAGENLSVKIQPEHSAELDWLKPYMRGPVAKTASIMLGSQALLGLGKGGNAYYRRMNEAYREQWPRLHEETVATLKAVPFRCESFYSGDVVEWVQSLPKDAPVVCFPPFFAGDYEAQFAALDRAFKWPAPEYEQLDAERMEILIGSLVDRPRWVFGNNVRREELEPWIRGVVQTTNRGVPIYIYAAGGPMRMTRPEQQVENVPAARLAPGEDLVDDAELRIALLTGGQFAALRSQYMNVNIRPGSPLLSFALLAGARLIGAFAISAGKFNEDAYLLSDFPVAPTQYKRLSKLVVAAALSTEAQSLMQRSMSKRVRSIRTTAFSDNPVSMKYRGLFDLRKREDSDDPLYRYQLDYLAKAGQWTLEEAYGQWLKKHAR